MTQDQPAREARYEIDVENVAEMARLAKQGREASKHFGLVPAALNLSHAQAILDIGCGPGEWVLGMAHRFLGCQFTGIDLSEQMLDYARYSAQEQERSNVHFLQMDARQPLDFPADSFDMVHARTILGFLSTTTWPQLVREVYRILRPGGIFCSLEAESLGITTSPSLTRFNALCVQAARLAGQCFTPSGDQFGVTAVQEKMLQDADFSMIQHEAFSTNYSAGRPENAFMYDDFRTLCKLVQPFLVRVGLISQGEIDVLYERMLSEIQQPSFCAVSYVQRVWGVKAA
ncbi:MAG TPA: methyltransferase domain-containing protein [Ktedonosporobacter sp.]|nr:methyltransferase domain-containing protein [Ktedonosporobacter sp.]